MYYVFHTKHSRWVRALLIGGNGVVGMQIRVGQEGMLIKDIAIYKASTGKPVTMA